MIFSFDYTCTISTPKWNMGRGDFKPCLRKFRTILLPNQLPLFSWIQLTFKTTNYLVRKLLTLEKIGV
jgi:hypothetical protein